MICWRRTGVRLLALASLAVVLGAPATSGAATTPLLGGCPVMTYERPFTSWLDLGNYVLMPNGGLESGNAGWRVSGGATAVAGNESFSVHGTGDVMSLSLPAGSSATTGGLCTGLTSPTLRFFARNSGSLLSTLKVEALYTDLLGQPRALAVRHLDQAGRAPARRSPRRWLSPSPDFVPL